MAPPPPTARVFLARCREHLTFVSRQEVLKELAGLSDADVAALYAQKVLVRDPALEGPKRKRQV